MGLSNSNKTALLKRQLDTLNVFNDQLDYVSKLARHIEYDYMMFKRENSVNWLTVTLFKGNRHLSWTFRTNTYDDYMTLGDCFAGTVSLSDAVLANADYSNLVGTYVTSASNAHYTTQVGATFEGTITGERIDFYHYADNRGGVWEFILDNNPEKTVTISTFSASVASPKAVTLYSGLENKQHTVKGTFKGADPLNAPSGGTARGWLWFSNGSTPSTFRSYKKFITNNRDKDFMSGFSNKEFAIRLRKKDIGTHQFVPMHSNIGTAYNAEPRRIFVDGVLTDLSTLPINEFINCDDVSVSQKIYARNPDAGAENLAIVSTTVTINKKGLAEIDGMFQALTDIDIADGYFLMCPVAKPIIDRVATSINNYYPCTLTDGSKTFLTNEKDRTTSFAFSSSTDKDNVVAMTILDAKNSLLPGATAKYAEGQTLWLEHRDTAMTKLYPSVFRNAVVTTGQRFKFSGSLLAATIPNVHDLL